MTQNDKRFVARDIIGLAVSLILVALAALFGGLFTAQTSGNWYQSLEQPGWSPPGWLFGPVWTTLYILLAAAAWLVWRRTSLAHWAVVLYLVQLVFNAAWSAIFFGLRMPMVAFAELCVLWVLIVLTTVAFWRVRTIAAVLMLPYLAWVSFAGALNLAIALMN